MRNVLAFAALLVCACTPSMQAGDESGVTLSVDPTTVAAGETVTLVLRNGSPTPVGYNLCSSGLEHNQAGAWHPIPSNRMCTMELRTLAPGEETRYPLEMPGGLEAGEYRFLTNLDMMGAAEGGSVRSGTFRVES